MNEKREPYILVCVQNQNPQLVAAELQARVLDAIKYGYVPLGGPCIAYKSENHAEPYTMSQAMVLDKPERPKS